MARPLQRMQATSTLVILTVISTAACQIDHSGLSGSGDGNGTGSNARGSVDAANAMGGGEEGGVSGGGAASGASGSNGADAGEGAGGASGASGLGGASGASGVGGASGANGAGGAPGGSGGAPVAVPGCTPGLEASVIIDCGYPNTSSGPLGAVAFNEAEVLRAIQPARAMSRGIVRVFYNDEHALTLGVRSVVVKSASGTTTTNYSVSALGPAPGSAVAPQTGTNEVAGDQSGLDPALRPMWPSLYLTDVTFDPSSRAGDWQSGGQSQPPNAVFGTWKAAVRTVDTTKPAPVVTITPDPDPPKNGWVLPGGDAVPVGLTNEGFGAEVRWEVDLSAGHSYRLQVIVHDGDQNKMGGDSAEACVVFCAGGPPGAGP